MRYNCRCTDRTNCGRRKTLSRDPEIGYINLPRCPGCGKRSLRHDPSVRKQTLKRTCRCNGIHFPHRIGTVLDENEFCHEISIDELKERLFESGKMTREEINKL